MIGVQMITKHKCNKEQKVITHPEVSDGGPSGWMKAPGSKWLKVGLKWSGTLTTLECAFLKPRKLSEALDADEIRSKAAAIQAFEIWSRLNHVRVPAHFQDAAKATAAEAKFIAAEAKFMIGFEVRDKGQFAWAPEHKITALTVVTASGEGYIDGVWLSDHLDFDIAAYLGKANERLFVEKACQVLFGCTSPSLEQMSKFILDAQNFDSACNVVHEEDYGSHVSRASRFFRRVQETSHS